MGQLLPSETCWILAPGDESSVLSLSPRLSLGLSNRGGAGSTRHDASVRFQDERKLREKKRVQDKASDTELA